MDNVFNSNAAQSQYDTLQQTLVVRLVKGRKTKLVRAFLDSVYQWAYITSSCAKEMGLSKVNEESIIQGVFGGTELPPKYLVYTTCVTQFETNMLEQQKVCNYIHVSKVKLIGIF